MVFEEVTLKSGDTLSQVANDYGYNLWDWQDVWDHAGNSALKADRLKPENLKSGDKVIIPLPWKITSKSLTPHIKGHGGATFAIRTKRNGVKGKNLRWVQTIFGDNQSMHPTPFGVDFPDDDDPFYYRTDEIILDPNRRSNFSDVPWRNPHATRTTAWRAVLSLCSVSDSRVSVFESIVWGIDFGKNGINVKYPIREATQLEVSGHLRLLKFGRGKTKTFKSGGWTFREAPEHY